MDKKFYIHIGMPKAASTTLQKKLFDYLPDFYYLGNTHKNPKIDQQVQTIIHVIIGCERSEYNEKHEELYRLLSDKLSSINEKRILISDESFATGYSRFPGQVEKFEIARRLKSFFPHSNILLIIRNQAKILKSLYTQRLRNSLNSLTWQDWLEEQKYYSYLTSQLSWYEYDKIYDTYSVFFGKENIYIALYEDLELKPSQFYSDLRLFFDNCIETSAIKECLSLNESYNKRPTRLNYTLTKIANNKKIRYFANLMPSTIKERIKKWTNSKGSAINPEYHEADLSFIKEFYSKSNYRMSRMLNCDLAERGYPVSY